MRAAYLPGIRVRVQHVVTEHDPVIRPRRQQLRLEFEPEFIPTKEVRLEHRRRLLLLLGIAVAKDPG